MKYSLITATLLGAMSLNDVQAVELENHHHHNKKHQRGQYVQLAGTDYGTGKDSYDYLYDDEVVSVRAKKATEQKEAAKVKKAAEWTDLYN